METSEVVEIPLLDAEFLKLNVRNWLQCKLPQHVCPVLNMKYGVFERKEGEVGGGGGDAAGGIVGRPPGWVLFLPENWRQRISKEKKETASETHVALRIS